MSKIDLNALVNFSSSRELVFRDAMPYFPLKNLEDHNGQLSATDVAMLDYYTDLIYEKKLPLSVILMEKKTDGLPTFHQMKALLMEKSKDDGMTFLDALVEGEHEALFGKLWKESVEASDKKDEDDDSNPDLVKMKANVMLNSMLGNKMKAVLSKREEFTTNNTQINVFDGMSPDILRRIKGDLVGK
jgi:hypothetical protein